MQGSDKKLGIKTRNNKIKKNIMPMTVRRTAGIPNMKII
jgi:hypothetical protein